MAMLIADLQFLDHQDPASSRRSRSSKDQSIDLPDHIPAVTVVLYRCPKVKSTRVLVRSQGWYARRFIDVDERDMIQMLQQVHVMDVFIEIIQMIPLHTSETDSTNTI